MCYGETYTCTVTCINTDLNTSLLKDGIVHGGQYGNCQIVCDSGKAIVDTVNSTGISNEVVTLVSFTIIISAIIMIFLLRYNK